MGVADGSFVLAAFACPRLSRRGDGKAESGPYREWEGLGAVADSVIYITVY
jgi:hypothetical protein